MHTPQGKCAPSITPHAPLFYGPLRPRTRARAEAHDPDAATARGRTPTKKSALEVTGPRVSHHPPLPTRAGGEAGETTGEPNSWKPATEGKRKSEKHTKILIRKKKKRSSAPRDQTGLGWFSLRSMSICDGFTSA